MEYCSIVSGLVVGTNKIATWLPFSASKAANRLSRAALSSDFKVPVRSVTRARSGGTATSAATSNPTSARSVAKTQASSIFKVKIDECLLGRSRRRGRRAEVDRGRTRDFPFVLDGEARLDLHADDPGGDVGREGADRDVILLDRRDVAIARHAMRFSVPPVAPGGRGTRCSP